MDPTDLSDAWRSSALSERLRRLLLRLVLVLAEEELFVDRDEEDLRLVVERERFEGGPLTLFSRRPSNGEIMKNWDNRWNELRIGKKENKKK
jgi:hypothetical protein